jgi:hypothetical protein
MGVRYRRVHTQFIGAKNAFTFVGLEHNRRASVNKVRRYRHSVLDRRRHEGIRNQRPERLFQIERRGGSARRRLTIGSSEIDEENLIVAVIDDATRRRPSWRRTSLKTLRTLCSSAMS